MYAMLTGRTRTDGAAKGVLTAHCKLRIRANCVVRKYGSTCIIGMYLGRYLRTKVRKYFRTSGSTFESTKVLPYCTRTFLYPHFSHYYVVNSVFARSHSNQH